MLALLPLVMNLSLFGGGSYKGKWDEDSRGGTMNNRQQGRKQKSKLKMNNQDQNEQVRAIKRMLNLTNDQKRILHKEIHGLGLSFQEVLDKARNMFNRP